MVTDSLLCVATRRGPDLDRTASVRAMITRFLVVVGALPVLTAFCLFLLYVSPLSIVVALAISIGLVAMLVLAYWFSPESSGLEREARFGSVDAGGSGEASRPHADSTGDAVPSELHSRVARVA
jgi:hypothetical protein